MSLPTYQCHKRVQAAKIKQVFHLDTFNNDMAVPGLLLELPDGSEVWISVTGPFLAKHKPEAGGYFVLYDDTYQSFSPAQAFEEGYTQIREDAFPAKGDPNWPLPSFDAQDWAEAFCKQHPQVSVEDALGWFANALMCGFDEHAWRQKKKDPA